MCVCVCLPAHTALSPLLCSQLICLIQADTLFSLQTLQSQTASEGGGGVRRGGVRSGGVGAG